MKHFSFAPYSPKLSSCSIRCNIFRIIIILLLHCCCFFPSNIVNLNVGGDNLVKQCIIQLASVTSACTHRSRLFLLSNKRSRAFCINAPARTFCPQLPPPDSPAFPHPYYLPPSAYCLPIFFFVFLAFKMQVQGKCRLVLVDEILELSQSIGDIALYLDDPPAYFVMSQSKF